MVYARNSLAVIRSDRLVRKKYHPAPTELRMKFALRVLTISTTLNPVRERRAMAIDRLALPQVHPVRMNWGLRGARSQRPVGPNRFQRNPRCWKPTSHTHRVSLSRQDTH